MAQKNIAEIDRNLAVQSILPEGVVLHSVTQEPFEIYGLFDPKGTGLFHRAPVCLQQDESINDGARRLMRNTAGGRVRFVTDSRNIAVKVRLSGRTVFSHMPSTGICGFDMYTEQDGCSRYVKTFVPPADNSVTEYEGIFTFDEAQQRHITLHMPLYNGVDELLIGLDEGCTLLPPTPYKCETPMVFYGSSVTQGGCASRPGMCHTNILTRWLDCDSINLGFSGSDKGERALAEYIAALPMSVFVHGYGYNAPSLEHYEQTYYPFYKIIRDKNPDLPIVMMSNPVCITFKEPKRAEYLMCRRQITVAAYLRAKNEGDNNVYFIDGARSLGTDAEAQEATVDGTHPTDLGFMSMANSLYPLLRRLVYGVDVAEEQL